MRSGKPRAVQVLLAQQRQLQGQPVLAGVLVLLDPAEVRQLGQHPVGRSLRQVEPGGDVGKAQPTGFRSQEFENLQAAIQNALDNSHD